MQEVEIELELVQAARSRGGDKYEGMAAGETMTVYIPQSVSRALRSAPYAKLQLTISSAE